MTTTARPTELAEAIVASLNAATFDPAIVAASAYLPEHALDDLDEIRITVTSASKTIERADRQRLRQQITIDIGLQKKLDATEVDDQADAIIALGEQIIEHLVDQRMTDAFMPPSITHEPIIDRQHLREQRVATSVISLTYTVIG